LRRESEQELVILLAHSMGGLAARAYLCEHGAAHIAKIITLGVPHHGTGLADIGIGENSDQMRWTGKAGSGRPNDWLQQLAARENPAHYALFVNIYSYHDNIVAPQTSSCLPGARNIACHGIGHVALAFNPLTMAMVMEEIMATSAQSE
jgi:triacylglycerol lipase